jgi:hypothetical protein
MFAPTGFIAVIAVFGEPSIVQIGNEWNHQGSVYRFHLCKCGGQEAFKGTLINNFKGE